MKNQSYKFLAILFSLLISSLSHAEEAKQLDMTISNAAILSTVIATKMACGENANLDIQKNSSNSTVFAFISAAINVGVPIQTAVEKLFINGLECSNGLAQIKNT